MPVIVKPVRSSQDFQSFVELTFRLNRGNPHWVPPLRDMYTYILDREQNPYFEHADAEYLVAEKDGEVAGHVIAHIDHALNDAQGTSWGLFGFFESIDDQETADELIAAAGRWLSERRRDRMVGPLGFSTKEDPGTLVEGHDRRPVVLQPWNPPHYPLLLERAGLRKVKDVLWRELDFDRIPQELVEYASKWATIAKERYGITIRKPSEDDVEGDLERVFRFIPPVFESHWAYVPWTERELEAGLGMAARLVGPGTLIAEMDGELIGASMMVPDFNQAIDEEDGQAVPTDRKIDQARLMFMAVSPQHRHLGVMPALSHFHLEDARRHGVKRLVIGWSHEDNQQMNTGMARLGLEVSRRHRIYQKELA